MIITIQDKTLLLDGIASGTVADSFTAYPLLQAQIFAAINTQVSMLLGKNTMLTKLDYLRSAAVNATPTPNPRTISNTEFKAKFTPEQLVQVWRLSLADDGVALLLFDVFTRTTINLDDPATVGGLGYLVSVGVALDLTLF